MKTRQTRKVGLAVSFSLAAAIPAQQLAHTATRAERYFFESLDDAPPSTDYWAAAPVSSRSTAQPAAQRVGVASADDWDSVEPEQLGALFLSRATEAEASDDV